MEDQWLDNKPFVSAISPGAYEARRMRSPSFGDTFALVGVPQRSDILFHWGNTHLDTQGCILLGQSIDSLWDDSLAIINSRNTFIKFMAAMQGVNVFELRVENRF